MLKDVLLALACVTGMLLACAACGGSTQVGPDVDTADVAMEQPDTQAAVETAPLRSIALDEALADLHALETPAGVEPGLFAELKRSLEQVLTDLYGPDGQPRGKAASTLPVEEMNRAWISQGRIPGPATVDVIWYGRHTGDYDVNSEVNIADLTPLALHMSETAEYDGEGVPVQNGDNEHKCQIDGDDNGEINSADVTVIGLNFGSAHTGYRVYAGYSEDGENFTWEENYLEGPDGPDVVSVRFNQSVGAGEIMRYALSFDMPAVPPSATLYVKIVPFDGVGEGLPEIMPVYPGPHSFQFCGACHTKVEKQFLGQDKSCQLCHNTAPEGGEWSAGPTMHQNCMNCHESHLFAISPPESVCGNCHSTQAAEVEESGMTACLICHQQAHIPDPSPDAATCGACHTSQATELSGGPMTDCNGCHNDHQFVITDEPATCKVCHKTPPDKPESSWGDAPGMHGSCQECHDQHSFTIADANAICANCHQPLIDGGHAGGAADCLTCHVSPHVPETIVVGQECTDCHTNPPEDPFREWADAPGLHADCGQCHSLTEHGDKPIPPESICGDCHQPLIDGGHAGGNSLCMECHVYPHLPESNTGGQTCQDCHPVPPEAPDKTWADVPGLHSQCGECHIGDGHPVPKPTPEEVEPICLSCHPEFDPEIPGNHQGALCMDCHDGGHMVIFNEANCFECHPF